MALLTWRLKRVSQICLRSRHGGVIELKIDGRTGYYCANGRISGIVRVTKYVDCGSRRNLLMLCEER